jgi:hypothetical protein
MQRKHALRGLPGPDPELERAANLHTASRLDRTLLELVVSRDFGADLVEIRVRSPTLTHFAGERPTTA